jgi:hypothetical protein
MRAHRLWLPCIAALCIATLLCACGDAPDDDTQRRADAARTGLPKPQRADGSVTGMPDKPGPGDVPITGAPPPPPPELLPGEAFGLPPLEDNPETGLADDDGITTSADEPSVDDAVAIVRDYYAAIAAGDFARAYGLWSDGGRSSGQTPEQFAAGFADTASVEVQPGEPGDIEAAAGSRYVEIPVSVSATQRDGGVRKYIGSYVLRRAVVDGASAEQRAWRIGSAELREVRP